MTVKCGNRKAHGDGNTYHVSVADVKACFAGQLQTDEDIITEHATAQLALARQGSETAAREVAWSIGSVPADVRARVLDRMTGDDPEDLQLRDQFARLWASDEAQGPVDEGNWREEPRTPARDEYETRPQTHFFGFNGDATEKQTDFINRLLGEKDLTSLPPGWVVELEDRIHTDDLGKRDASAAIDQLLTLPSPVHVAAPVKAAKPAAAAPAPGLAYTDGIFRNPQTGEIFKGQFNRAQGDGRRLYFKRLVLTNGEWDEGAMFEVTNILLDESAKAAGQAQAGKLEWRYVGGPQKAGVLQAWMMTREEAAAFGALYGVCVRCHRDLTREESIERAMGPICAGKQGW